MPSPFNVLTVNGQPNANATSLFLNILSNSPAVAQYLRTLGCNFASSAFAVSS